MPVRKRGKIQEASVKPLEIMVNKFNGGVKTLLDQSRLDQNSVYQAQNMMLDQDGVWRVRYGSQGYGNAFAQTRSSTSVVTTNLVTNPSLESSMTGWNIYHSGTLSLSTAQAFVGTQSLKVVTTGIQADGASYNPVAGLTASSSYTFSAYIYASAGVVTTVECDTYTAGSAFVAATSTTITGNGAWQRVNLTVNLGSTETQIQPFIYTATSTTIYIDAAQLQTGGTATTYFDGSLTNTTSTDYAWTGAANASTSTQTVYTLNDPVIDGIGRATVYNTDGTMVNYLFVIVSGSLKYTTDTNAWQTVAGSSYVIGKPAQLTQINSRLYITNGSNKLSYLDLTNFTIITYTPISSPGAPTLARTVLTAGSYNVYYKITAIKSAIGETAASSEATISVNKLRTQWKTDGSEHIDLTWSAVTGADGYNIYYSPQTGQEIFLDSVGTSATTYSDTGQLIANPYQAAPPTDGTAGGTGAVMCLSGNRIWTANDPAFPYRISWTGTAQDLGSFNPFHGGGYIDLNLGGDERVTGLQQYRDGKGNQTIVAYTTSPASGGEVWFITLSALTASGVAVVVPAAVSQGTIGSTSSRGLVQANNNVYYPSIKGFQSLGSAPNVLNVLVTNEVSTGIRPSVKGINNQYSNQICGIYYYGRIFYSVPFGSTVNNQIWVLDLERQAWCLPWTIGVKQFMEYTDSVGQIHLLAIPVTGTKLIEFSENFQGDSGVGFSTNLQSGLIPWNENHFGWAWIGKFYGEFSNPRGNIKLTVSGTAANKTLTTLKTITISNTVTSSGVGSDLVGAFEVGQSNNAPKTFSQASSKKVLYINKALNNIQWQITSSDINAAYTLMELGIVGNLIESGDPSSWRK